MNIACPHCSQPIEVDAAYAGHQAACPICSQTFLIPALSALAAAGPAVRRPTATGSPLPKKRSGGGGFGSFLLVLILLCGAAFGYVMVHFKDSPQQAWTRVTQYVQQQLQPAPPPSKTPLPPAPAEVPAPAAPVEAAAPEISTTPAEVDPFAETTPETAPAPEAPPAADSPPAAGSSLEEPPPVAAVPPVPELPAPVGRKASMMDELVMGDAASESSHNLMAAFPPVVETKEGSSLDRTSPEPSAESAGPPSAIVTGGLGQKARVLLPRTPNADMYGGELNITMKVDPVNQNYFTMKLWGSDNSDDGSLILNCEGHEIGKRHGNSAADIFVNHGGPWFPNRFWYRTATLPLKLTKGKTTVQIKLRSAGKIYDYNNQRGKSYIPDYQHLMKNPSWQMYRVYTHLGGFVDNRGEVQGMAFAAPKHTSPGPEVVDEWKKRVNDNVSGKIKKGIIEGGNIPAVCRNIGYLAQNYEVSWSVGYRKSELVETAIKSIDRVATLSAADPKLAGGEWGGAFGPMGEAVWILYPAMKSRMSEIVDFGGEVGKVTRKEGWSKALRASVDAGRYNRRSITNQEVICAENIYAANKGLLLVDPANALPEKEALRYPYEAAGLSPFMGSDERAEGNIPKRGNAPYGPNWFYVTTGGTTKEPSFVGSDYGEMGVGVYRMGRMAGDRKLMNQGIKMFRARGFFRFPGVDKEGFMIMTAAAPVGARNNYLPGHNVYTTRDVSDTGASVVGHEDSPHLSGWLQQQLADGQLYAMIANEMGKKTGALGAPFFPDDLEAALKKPKSGILMPTAPGAPDFAWGDEENMVVAAKHGEELFFVNMVWRGNVSINKAATFFNVTPTTAARGEIQLDDIRFVPTGKFETASGEVDSFKYKNPPDNKLYPNAEIGNQYPIAIRPDLKEAPQANQDGGRGTGYTLCYGHWLIGMNGNYTTGPYTMKLPKGFTGAVDMVSGKTLTAPIVIQKGTTVVFYLPQPTVIPKSPDSTPIEGN